MNRHREVDVLIVGAGLGGIGAACRLQTQCPSRSFEVLEARDSIGGTWDLFRYPGIRSDSDMFTLAYPFQPWLGEKSIVAGPDILAYIRRTAAQHGIDRRIMFGHRVEAASWSSERARWTLDVTTPQGRQRYTCRFLIVAAGYYDYEHPYEAQVPGLPDFGGDVVHPQFWPEGLDHRGKRIVIIGSGATAITLLPALAQDAAHVTQLQRSPSYVISRPSVDAVADFARDHLPARSAHTFARWKNLIMTLALYEFSRRFPDRARALLTAAAAEQLPESCDAGVHFNPRYDPWDERLCLAPDGDYFAAIRSGAASVVTDRIRRVTQQGIELESGEQVVADIIITATGLEVQFAGGMDIRVDGTPVEPARHLIYRGLMLSGVPNLALIMGYVNASWTLRADLSARYACRLINLLARRGLDSATPVPPPGITAKPLMELSSGYLQRALPRLPKQGGRTPWYVGQNQLRDWFEMRFADLSADMEFR